MNPEIGIAQRHGRHLRNKPTNDTFKRIHTALAAAHCTAHVRYIPSANNPADNLSCGIYSPLHLLLPPIPIPNELRGLIADFDDPSAFLPYSP